MLSHFIYEEKMDTDKTGLFIVGFLIGFLVGITGVVFTGLTNMPDDVIVSQLKITINNKIDTIFMVDISDFNITDSCINDIWVYNRTRINDSEMHFLETYYFECINNTYVEYIFQELEFGIYNTTVKPKAVWEYHNNSSGDIIVQ